MGQNSTQTSIAHAAMPKKSDDEWEPDNRGRYRRRVGFWLNKAEKREQYRFTFGKNLAKAKARLARVRELWAFIEEEAQQPKKVQFPPQPSDLDQSPRSPLWDGTSLWVAQELAAGKVQVVVGKGRETPESYAHAIHQLAQRFPCVAFVPSDVDAHSEGADFLDEAARFRLEEVRQLSPNVLPHASGAFHDALDRYVESQRREYTSPTVDGDALSGFGAQVVSTVKSLKARHKDIPLATFDFDGCQEIIDYWRNRPNTIDKRIKPPRRMAKDTCENHIAELQRFFRWLHRSKAFSWRKPADYGDLRTLVKLLPDERTSNTGRTKRKFYLPEELAVINKYATPLERLLLLLGLNCGFKGAEMGTLLPNHLFVDQVHPNADYLKQVSDFDSTPSDSFIIYGRNKTTVMGEFVLWPQTVQVLKWAIERRDRITKQKPVPYENLLITEKGTLFHRMTSGEKNQSQIFNNKWRALNKRIKKDFPEFEYFSFKTLRESASDLVRQVGGGEVAGVFLMHGDPVPQDKLLEVYTKRPFGKVFEALRELEHGKLRAVLDAAPEDPTAQPAQQYTPLKRQERIIELKRQGKTVSEIAEAVGVSKTTVTRTITRLMYKPKKRSIDSSS